MPINDYKCRNCKKTFEFFKLRSDDAVQCPHCGAKGEGNMEKQVPKNTSFKLKGKNWFRDGY